MALGRELLGTPAEPIGRALLAWAAMEREDGETAREHLRQLRERFADWTLLRLAMAELAESYGFTDEAEGEYRRLLSEVPMTPEGLRAREHWLRRLVETDKAEEAVRFFLDSLRVFRDDWAKSGWAETFREIATTALQHNRIANLAEAWRTQKVAHPDHAWLYDLMAHFSESEGNLDDALEVLHQATLTYPRMPIFAARWCQLVLRLHEEARHPSPRPAPRVPFPVPRPSSRVPPSAMGTKMGRLDGRTTADLAATIRRPTLLFVAVRLDAQLTNSLRGKSR
jgi:tetratricopeptide (TPR) repeat protein